MPGPGVPRDRDLDRLWQAVVGRLGIVLGPRHIGYLRDSRAVSLEGDRLTVLLCSRFAVDWLPQKAGDALAEAVEAVWGRRLDLEFAAPGGNPSEGLLATEADRSSARPTRRLRLDPSYTFERYLVTDGNLEAFTAATMLADGCACPFSSLVITGTPGIGKTHLLHALAWRAAERRVEVASFGWTEFINGFSRSIRQGTIDEFKDGVRAARLLVIDDLRDAAEARKSADELQDAIDAVTAAGGRVVVSAERPPRELDLPQRLKSRLESGPVIAVQPFRAAERLQFAQEYCRRAGINLPTWALERICAMEPDSVRTLQGALGHAWLLARTGRLDLAALDLALANLALCEAAAGRPESIEAIIEHVARTFGCSAAEIRGQSRARGVADARAAAAAAIRKQGLSLSEVGARLGRSKQRISEILERGEQLLAQRQELARLAG